MTGQEIASVSFFDSIRTRLTLAFALIVLLPMLVIGIVQGISDSKGGQAQLAARLEMVAGLKEETVNVWLDTLAEEVGRILAASGEQYVRLLEQPSRPVPVSLGRDLHREAVQRGSIEALFLLDRQGRVVVSSEASQVGQVYGEQPFFLRGLESASFGLDPDSAAILAVRPVLDRAGRVLGVLAGRAAMDELGHLLPVPKVLGRTGTVYLVAGHNALIAAAQGPRDVGQVRSQGIAAALEQNSNGSGSYENFRGVPVVGAYRWLPRLGAALLVEQEREEAAGNVYVVLAVNVGVTLAALLIAALASLGVTRGIATPLAELAETAATIAEGRLAAVAVVGRRDEVGVLAETFNLMTARLRQTMEGLHESRELLQSLIDNSATVISLKDQQGRYLLINRRFEEVYHVNRRSMVGKTDVDLFPPQQVAAIGAVDKQVLATGTVLETEEVVLQDDGLHTYLSLKAPLLDAAGKPYAVYGISTDITRRKQDEMEIRRLNEELRQKIVQLQDAQDELVRKEKLAILGQLAGTVGHELRNPLGVMNNAVFFLQMVSTEADETTREYLDIIKNEIDNSQRILTDLLDFARTKTPQTKAVAPRDLIDECVGRCSFPDTVQVRIELPDTLPALQVDPLQLGQVLQNLMLNSVQAMPDGGTLRIAAEPAPAVRSDGNPEPLLRLSVADTGVGISAASLQRLFQPLFTTKPKGIGLGLVVCKNLTEANGGWIEVESREGEGTTFTLVLPTGAAEPRGGI